ncbi:phosphoenolpyruvate carboxykinase (ATP) [Bacillus mycoides]|uniref:Phosphoenolpyruvate carboxykinase (ATP) n=4 Tax=Bacillus cereus group TaxID=86661 RepID=PCKA_BACMK|nr:MULTISPECIES: phosphoenolpyruvate carboxykinase (ATP) [Bacillus]A9VLC7.1 RecName: Full=Phosphoenolpyruvate carboxykinase (ATP); Short=PCK; Short=PEP carboxykinase; Short=PEPCK [Bacillus mycoides KBAB4]EEL03893.1 Phosphoenolpyruvate carboxykinase [Bacillus cereus BDRD-ST196]EJQ65865.1 phosphoenolpyruvate carboxykinase [ATP] [Bacillus cereus HuA2-4]EJS02887.1 phosphoenolpyruvate carboxykinase [ATP] [Bacillus cereus VDM034]EJS15950.1 phosphoenolpyruvate carboxykinase [ATP] [Bacillus cereus VDM
MSTVNVQIGLHELLNGSNAQIQLSVPQLVEKVLMRNEGKLTSTGAVSASTGKYTGRSPKDKFIVKEASVADKIAWGAVNQPISEEHFNKLYIKVLEYLKEKEELFIFKGFAGADRNYRLPIQVVNEYAWHNLFVHQLFIRPNEEELATHESEFTIVSAPNFKADPAIDGTNSEAFIMVSFEKRIVLIGGTEYAGEMKKSIFSIMNFLLPEQDILSMHCSSNVGEEGDVALFFGLSGTGKTTLSADPNRKLIGDDEHGWSDNGVFNIEGGCYAKCVNLSHEKEPQIFDAIKFGSVLENVVIDGQTRIADYNDTTLTENTRAAYPMHAIDNIVLPSVAGHPNTIIFLTADASGVLPPISKLSKEQAMYHFLSGYTSKLAGTERGVTSPQATFSTCFGSPFLPLDASRYAEMLGEKIEKHDAKVFLVNTGWTGGEYGVGKRMNLGYTRAMIQAALSGELAKAETAKHDIFGLEVPRHVPGVPDEVLMPEQTWADKDAYKVKAIELANEFKENFKKFDSVSEAIINLGGPIA